MEGSLACPSRGGALQQPQQTPGGAGLQQTHAGHTLAGGGGGAILAGLPITSESRYNSKFDLSIKPTKPDEIHWAFQEFDGF
ncbi:hypothetical protein ACLOJK_003965 [Asimina triloba]